MHPHSLAQIQLFTSPLAYQTINYDGLTEEEGLAGISTQQAGG